jgi:hypothetical protein
MRKDILRREAFGLEAQQCFDLRRTSTDTRRKNRPVTEYAYRYVLYIANSVDLTGLSLEVDLTGVELAHAGEAREQGEVKKAS